MTSLYFIVTRICAVCFFCFLVLVASGCNSAPKGGAPAAKVKGVANIDTKPIATGEVHFSVPEFPPRVIEIKDGKFEGEAPVGKNKVEVFIYKETKSEKYGGTPAKSNTVPEKYWGADTMLSATVEAGGANEFKFDITSK